MESSDNFGLSDVVNENGAKIPMLGRRSLAGVGMWLGCALLVAAFLTIPGCGGGQDLADEDAIEAAKKARAARDEKDRLEQLEVQKLVEARRKAKEEERKKKAEELRLARLYGKNGPRPGRRASVGDDEEGFVVYERPRDVASWTKQDYIDAKRQQDRRLVEALKHFSERFRGNTAAAEMLVQLLKPVEPDHDDVRNGSSEKAETVVRQQTEALVSALAMNGTDRAREALDDLILGKLECDDPEMARRIALETVIADRRPDDDQLLFQALLLLDTAESRHANQKFSGMLRKELLEMVLPDASARLRLMVAKNIDKLADEELPKEQILRHLLTEDVRNLEAQTLLYRGGICDARVDRQLESYFIRFSSSAAGLLLGIPLDRSAATGRRSLVTSTIQTAAEEAEFSRCVAESLWKRSLVQQLSHHLRQVDSLEQSAPLVVLAGTIPSDTARKAIFETLMRNWQDGPEALKSRSGMKLPLVGDPGWMMIIKTVTDEVTRNRSTQVRLNSAGPSWGTVKDRSLNPRGKTLRSRAEAARDWLEFASEHVLAWCKWAEQAGSARAAKAIKAGEDYSFDPAGSGFPLDLHRDARVVVHYQVDWPSEFPETSDAVSISPLRVHYVRIEERNLFSRLLSHYRRQVPAARESLIEKGAWLTKLGETGERHMQRSVDIVIHRDPDASAAASSGKDELLRVDVLILEMVDPSSEPGDAGEGKTASSVRPSQLVPKGSPGSASGNLPEKVDVSRLPLAKK